MAGRPLSARITRSRSRTGGVLLVLPTLACGGMGIGVGGRPIVVSGQNGPPTIAVCDGRQWLIGKIELFVQDQR
jgi:hypothetical protein